VVIFEDLAYRDPATSQPASLNVSDVLALKRSLLIQQDAPFADFIARAAASARRSPCMAHPGRRGCSIRRPTTGFSPDAAQHEDDRAVGNSGT
jgi:hypothetical protein